eukprot:2490495-Alexandrium_andersonii.AAC.1
MASANNHCATHAEAKQNKGTPANGPAKTTCGPGPEIRNGGGFAPHEHFTYTQRLGEPFRDLQGEPAQ